MKYKVTTPRVCSAGAAEFRVAAEAGQWPEDTAVLQSAAARIGRQGLAVTGRGGRTTAL